MQFNLLVILGPTATGKTRLAACLAEKLSAEIISADSRQVYRGLNIGAGKDLADYAVNGHPINYHLIDIVDTSQEYSVYNFIRDFYSAYNLISEKNRLPLLAGGTGLYLSAVLQNYNMIEADFDSPRYRDLARLPSDELVKILLSLEPGLHNTTDLLDKERLIKAIIVNENKFKSVPAVQKTKSDLDSFIIGINPPREEVRKRITERLLQRLDSGMIEEVRDLISSGVPKSKLEFFGLEYRFISRYIFGELSRQEMISRLNIAIHQFAKRQMTWFRRMEKQGVKINWLEYADENAALKLISERR